MIQELPWERTERLCTDLELVEIGKQVLLEEADALRATALRLGAELAQAARKISRCRGRVVVVGLGKSGHVGRKTAATFASLGIPAFFLHAAEGAHGDLGMVCREDVGLFISNSGETREVVELIPHFRRLGAGVIAMTGRGDSQLAKSSDVWLDCSVEREADPLGLAPTSSTTVQMAVADALVGMSTHLQGLRQEDFALFHPGGALGRRLLLRVSDLMGSGDRLPVVSVGDTVSKALFEITSKGYGAAVVVDAGGLLQGIFTDGDLRRLLEKGGENILGSSIECAMTKNPKTTGPDRLAAEAMRVMEEMEISVIIVVDQERPVGILHLHEILKAGVV